MLEDLNHPDTEPDRTVRRINDEEQRLRRKVRGRDFNDWHSQIERWRKAGEHEQLLSLFLEIIAAAETLPQYDSREPRYEWYLWCAAEYEALGRVEQAIMILRRWEYHWPPDRDCYPSHRDKIASRIRRLRRLFEGGSGAV